MLIKRKKGIELNQSFGAVLTLVLIAVLVIISIFLLVTLQPAFLTQDLATQVTNETGAYLNSSNAGGYNLSTSGRAGFGNAVINRITNSSGTLIASGNYTLTNGKTLTNLTNINATYFATVNNLYVSYNYTWDADTGASNATNDLIVQFGTYPALIGLLGTIIFLGLVIGVLIASFAFGGRKGA